MDVGVWFARIIDLYNLRDLVWAIKTWLWLSNSIQCGKNTVNFVNASHSWIISQVTTARKAVTLLLSYLIFTKPLTEQHGTGLLLISMGIILKLLPDPKRAPTSSSMPKIEKPAYSKENRTQFEKGEENEENRPLV